MTNPKISAKKKYIFAITEEKIVNSVIPSNYDTPNEDLLFHSGRGAKYVSKACGFD